MIWNPPTGQWFVAHDGQRWWFDSGSIAFDFAYTGGFPGPREWEHWHVPDDTARWWHERLGVEVTVSEMDYERARELRQAIAEALTAVSHDQQIPEEAVTLIDQCATRPDVPPQLRATPTVTSDRLLATIARDAVAALGQTDRIRVCGAEDCAVMFLDISRSGNRAWCSMQRCGNRHKVRALRVRRAAANSPNDPQSLPEQESEQ